MTVLAGEGARTGDELPDRLSAARFCISIRRTTCADFARRYLRAVKRYEHANVLYERLPATSP